MKTVVIPSEYNPFHKGHQYQVETLKKEYGFDCVVSVMSGCCVQRGDIAVFDKKIRSMAAVESGVDLVVQLPFVYAGQNAEMFAYGAVSLADNLRGGYLCCGAENPERKDDMLKAAEIIETGKLKELLKDSSKSNIPFATERIKALQEFTGIDYGFLEKPNNILALEYLRAIIRTESDIEPVFIKRNFEFESASQVREHIYANSVESVKENLPECAWKIYDLRGTAIRSLEDFRDILKYLITVKSEEEINALAESFEGIAQRFKQNSELLNESVDAFVHKVNTRTVPNSRIRRILVNMLMNYRKTDYEFYRNYRTNYLRVLAADETGREIIKQLKDREDIAVITKLSRALSEQRDEVITAKDIECIKFDILAEDVVNAKYGNPPGEDIRYTPWIKK